MHWANTYMKKALLLESVARAGSDYPARFWSCCKRIPTNRRETAYAVLSHRGLPLLATIITATIQTFQDDRSVDRTPHETMELAYREMKESLAQDLLARVKTCSPGFREPGIGRPSGHGVWRFQDDAAQSVGQTGDGGSTASSSRTDLVWTSCRAGKTVGETQWGAPLSSIRRSLEGVGRKGC